MREECSDVCTENCEEQDKRVIYFLKKSCIFWWEIVCFGPFSGVHDDPAAGVQGEARTELRGRAQEGVQKGKKNNYY